MPQDTYTIGDKEFKLTPLKGRRARRVVPRIIEIAAALFNMASSGGVNILSLFGENAESPSVVALAQAAYGVATFFKDEYDEIEGEIFPVVLCLEDKDWVYVDEEATPGELYKALWIAIQYHLETSFGVEVQEALKNLQEEVEAEEEVKEETQD